MSRSAKILNSSTFRLAAIYLMVFAVSVGAILAYIYWNTAVLLERQTDETIRAEIRGLNEQYRFGRIGTIAGIVRRRAQSNSERGIYSIFDRDGIRVAGNLEGVPDGVDAASGWIEFPFEVQGSSGVKEHSARAFYVRLQGGYTLVVGRDVEELRQFADLIRRTVFIAIGMALVFGIGGGMLMSRNFLRRIDTISATTRSIMIGDLSERVPVRGTNDEIDQLSGNLNSMLDQIERLMAGMRDVSDSVAHDLRTPLTRLRARIESALRQESREEYERTLHETLAEADQILSTFSALLDIARAESGQARDQLEPLDASEIAKEIAGLYEPIVEDADGQLDTCIAPGLMINGSRQLLAQAISNLMENALKYAGPSEEGDGKLSIELVVERDHEDVRIRVADNGPGIPEADRGRVLERFVRLDTSRSQPGNGLGLSLVAGVARLHDGDLRFEDRPPGFAATLVLPAHTQSR